ncbi:TPA: hypothetical protein I7566_15915 [Vibrio cholerae]|uniref:Uncharacterized protein n=1 Tax=Vibrio cholerae TaxID=666 RepID=A0A2V4PBE3_VIBCL|nr:hypothetical protein C1H56_13825 [Vibrio cholerae]AVH53059.1 hypothetical protein C4E16_12045 [Vibrio cholerae O1 biovar El Tor]AVI59734.1 hypothetical protein A6J62_19720 [Vibrio cholerae]AYV11268.1 hypothetical protein EEL44_20555 [Vibrio cholerae]EGQ9202440.1 hypothetical protein [Vibrio cholerae]
MFKISSFRTSRNRFALLVQKAQLSKMNLVGRILTRNRKAPRIGDLQEEESNIQDECSARKA